MSRPEAHEILERARRAAPSRTRRRFTLARHAWIDRLRHDKRRPNLQGGELKEDLIVDSASAGSMDNHMDIQAARCNYQVAE